MALHAPAKPTIKPFGTLQAFLSAMGTLACRHCGHIGLESEHNTNNNGVRPRCPQCGSVSPLSGVQWLKQNRSEGRKLKRPSGDPTPSEVWEANGGCCAYCGKTREECERYGVGITVQHVKPFADGGDRGPLAPFCARCQQGSTAAQAETRLIRRAWQSIEEQLARIRDKQEALDRERAVTDRA